MSNDRNSEIALQHLKSEFTTSEIVFGIVSPVGTDKDKFIWPLTERMKNFYKYHVEKVKVSEKLSTLPLSHFKDGEFARIRHFMDAGDEKRKIAKDNAIVAASATETIKELRKQNESFSKRAYIVDSLKHPDEVHFLRKIYGDGFFLFGIHADKQRRKENLIYKGCSDMEAEELIKIDEDEKIDHGQKTRDAFHLADFFLYLQGNDDIAKNSIDRFLKLIFSHPYQNPTFHEFAMFMAFNSSARSGDLSRQVGAVITKQNQILATGANDCPKAGGGLYWASPRNNGKVEDEGGGKDYKRNADSNDKIKQSIIDEIVGKIKKELLEGTGKENEETLRKIIQDSTISDITEFGRVVHAEMEAILSCARIGVSTIGTTLYCTTFPCHNCAKHIVSAGINRVVYVEPYPKSKAFEFYSDSIKIKNEKNQKNDGRVSFEPFTGVGSRRFLDLFSMSLGGGYKLPRKDDGGNILHWDNEEKTIRTPLLPMSYLEIESEAIKIWEKVKLLKESAE